MSADAAVSADASSAVSAAQERQCLLPKSFVFVSLFSPSFFVEICFGYVCLSFMRLRVRLLTIIHRGVTTIAEPLI